MLSACPTLSTIKASNCSLKGTMPNLGNLAVKVDGLIYTVWSSSLAESLQNLDLGANHISEVSSLPMKIQSLSLAKMNTGVHLQKGILRDASSKKILLDLSGVRLMNSSEAADMLQGEELRGTLQFSMIDRDNGFQCKDLEGSSLRVTPHMFLPNQLCGGLDWHRCSMPEVPERHISRCRSTIHCRCLHAMPPQQHFQGGLGYFEGLPVQLGSFVPNGRRMALRLSTGPRVGGRCM